jgi:hypothetical protein
MVRETPIAIILAKMRELFRLTKIYLRECPNYTAVMEALHTLVTFTFRVRPPRGYIQLGKS